jgi:hypothetical protein
MPVNGATLSWMPKVGVGAPRSRRVFSPAGVGGTLCTVPPTFTPKEGAKMGHHCPIASAASYSPPSSVELSSRAWDAYLPWPAAAGRVRPWERRPPAWCPWPQPSAQASSPPAWQAWAGCLSLQPVERRLEPVALPSSCVHALWHQPRRSPARAPQPWQHALSSLAAAVGVVEVASAASRT